jgi:hypothetical protein
MKLGPCFLRARTSPSARVIWPWVDAHTLAGAGLTDVDVDATGALYVAITFAARPANIIASRLVWKRMLKLLERGDNIMEGHYSVGKYHACSPRHPPHSVPVLATSSST